MILCHVAAIPQGDDGGGESLSAFVGNAVLPGDPCMWHVDADPACLPPGAPWVHHHGYYYNREPAKPYFVSSLVYLNDQWPDEAHAETLFLDPESRAGLFVQPVPGRVVLMCQARLTAHPASLQRMWCM